LAHLTGTPGGQNGSTVLSVTTVSNDRVRDVVIGGLGLDWFLTSLGDRSDRTDPEQALTV
jgi:hypothetical protein